MAQQLTQAQLIKALAELLAKKAIKDALHFSKQDVGDDAGPESVKAYLMDFADENLYVYFDASLKLDQAVQKAYKRLVNVEIKK